MAANSTKSKTTIKKTNSSEIQTIEKDRKRVDFSFPAPDAQNVALVGDFNNWDYTNTMKKDKDGVWRVRIELKPGKYEYRYLVDGEWRNDPSCQKVQPNQFGTYNCVVEVSN